MPSVVHLSPGRGMLGRGPGNVVLDGLVHCALERHAVASHVGVVCTGGGQVVGDDGVSVVILTGGLTPPTDTRLPHVVSHRRGPRFAVMRHHVTSQVGIVRALCLLPRLTLAGGLAASLGAGSTLHVPHLPIHRCEGLPLSKQLGRVINQARQLLIAHGIEIATHAVSHSTPSRLIQYVFLDVYAVIAPLAFTVTCANVADAFPHETINRCDSRGVSSAAISPEKILYSFHAWKAYPDRKAPRPRNLRVLPFRPIARRNPCPGCVYVPVSPLSAQTNRSSAGS